MQWLNADGRDVTMETLANIRKVVGQIGQNGTLDDLRKASQVITLSNNLVAYDLEAPAKNLDTVLTPLRHPIPRKTRGVGAGDAVHWRQVDSIAAGGIVSMPWVGEGQRAPRMVVNTSSKSANYVTIGLETDVTFEAVSAGEGFEDVLASSGMRLLQQAMILEEFGVVGGNRSVALGTPVLSAVTGAGTGGSIGAGDYNVAVLALTMEGYLASSVTNGLPLTSGLRQVTITGMDNLTYALNGGSSKASVQVSTGTLTGTSNTISAAVTPIKGAVAWAWFVDDGAGGNMTLQAITNINSVKLTALTTTHQILGTGGITDSTSDRSNNASLAFDGLIYGSVNNASAYWNALPTGAAGVGTSFTSSGRGTINEIDAMLKSQWDNFRSSPDEMWVSAQELNTIYKRVQADGSGNALVRFVITPGDGMQQFTAGQLLAYYTNPFSMTGGQLIPIKLHPNLPPGTMFGWTQNLPAYYQSANVPQVAEIQCRRDYYQIPWPIVTRANQTGVYAEEVLKLYFPMGISGIYNIAPA